MKEYTPFAPLSVPVAEAFTEEGLGANFTTSNTLEIADINEFCAGVVKVKADAGDTVALYGPGCWVMARAGGAFTPGEFLTTNAAGEFVEAGLSENVSAIARGTGVDNEKVLIELLPKAQYTTAGS